MACRVGGKHSGKYGIRNMKSDSGESRAVGTAAPSIGRKDLRSASVGAEQTSTGRLAPRQGAKAAFDGRNGCQKCFCVTFGESNKAYAPYPALITPEQGERRVIEENDQFYDRERFCQP